MKLNDESWLKRVLWMAFVLRSKMKLRYRLYREHKYVCFVWSELERLIAKTDFTENQKIDAVMRELHNLETMMHGHAQHEDSAIHALLREKGSTLYKTIEAEHKNHGQQFAELHQLLDRIIKTVDAQERILLGHNFYLAYRKFECENLKHLNDEESIVMPELQRLCSDDELRSIDFNTYNHMTSEQMIDMIKILFPHMNPDDKAHFLNDIQDSAPEKFKIVLESIV